MGETSIAKKMSWWVAGRVERGENDEIAKKISEIVVVGSRIDIKSGLMITGEI